MGEAERPGRIHPSGTERDKKVSAPVTWSSFDFPTALDKTIYSYKWGRKR
jgi:hypothetical protein